MYINFLQIYKLKYKGLPSAMSDRKSRSRSRQTKKSLSHGARTRSRSHSGAPAGAIKVRKPRRARSHSKSREKIYPMGHDKKKSRSRSKAKLKDKTCKSIQAMDHVSETMNLSDLQNIAKKKGIAFGGLTKKQLVRKICEYS